MENNHQEKFVDRLKLVWMGYCLGCVVFGRPLRSDAARKIGCSRVTASASTRRDYLSLVWPWLLRVWAPVSHTFVNVKQTKSELTNEASGTGRPHRGYGFPSWLLKWKTENMHCNNNNSKRVLLLTVKTQIREHDQQTPTL